MPLRKLTGTDGAEKIAGGEGNDTLDGMGGDDEIGTAVLAWICSSGGPGADKISGGGPNDLGDTVSYAYSPMGVNINLRAGTASGGDADGDELAADIENVRGSMLRRHALRQQGRRHLSGVSAATTPCSATRAKDDPERRRRR